MIFRFAARQRNFAPAAITCLLVFAGLLMVSGPVDAQVISWSLDSSGTVGGNGAGDHSGVSGQAGAYLAGNWTNSWPSNLTHDLQDSTGVSTLLDIAPASFNTYQIQGSHPGQDADNSWNKEMLNGYLNAGPAAWNPWITYSEVALSQIPYSTYDIYVYFSSDVAGRAGDVTDLTTTYSFNTLGPASIAGGNAAFVQTTDTGGTYTTAANYAKFSGLSGASQTVRVQMRDADLWGGIAGFQVVNTGSAPAAPIDWKNDADGNWNNTANWVGGAVPGAGANVRLGNVITADRTVTLDVSPSLNSITFDNPIGDGDYFLVPSSTQSLTLTGAAQVTAFGRPWLRAAVAGTSGMNTLGHGELILDAVNTFSGGLNVNETSVAVTKAGAIPAGNAVSITNGGAVRFFGSDNGFFLDNGTGLDPNTTLTFNNNVSMAAGSYVDVNGGADVSFGGILSGDGGLGAQSGAKVSLTTANTYTGATNVNGATLTVSGAGKLGSTAGGTAIYGDGTVVLNGVSVGDEGFGITGAGQLQLSGATVGASAGSALISLWEAADGTRAKIASSSSSTVNSNIYAGPDGDGTYYEIASDSGTLTLSGTISAVDAGAPNDRNYVFSGAGNFNVTGKITDYLVDAAGNPDASLTNNGDNISVIKRGAGKLTINTKSASESDYWKVATVVEEGTLEVMSDGANQGELWSDTIDVRSGATFDVDNFSAYALQIGQKLGGAGTVLAGTLELYDDNSLTPGDSVGTLHVTGNIAVNPGGTSDGTGSLNYELGNTTTVGSTENDLIAVTGTLTTPNAPTLALNVRFVEGNIASSGSSYTLATFASSGTAPTISGITPHVLDAAGNALTIRPALSVTSTTTAIQLGVSGNTQSYNWSGNASGTWDKGASGPSNWTSSDQKFYDLDDVTFSSGPTRRTITVAQDVSPDVMTVNGGVSYSFSGSAINATSVTVTGSATASFANSVGGSVVAASTGTVAGTGTFKNNVTAQSGGKLRIGGATMPTSNNDGIISWSLDNTGTVGGNGIGDHSGVSGQAGVVTAGNWTNSWPSNLTTNLQDNSAAATTLDISYSSFNTWHVTGSHPGQDLDGSWNNELLNGYLNAGPAGWNPPITYSEVAITEIPYTAYDLYVYFSSDVAGREGEVTDFATTYYFNTVGPGSVNPGGNAVFAQTTNTTGAYTTAANYAKFSGLSGASQTLRVQMRDNDEWAGIAGFQVVGNPAIQGPVGETMFVLGDVSLESGSTVSFNIAGSGYGDLLSITGNLGIGAGVNLEVLLDGSVSASSLQLGDSWDLFNFGSTTGTLGDFNITLPAGLSSGLEWNTSNLLVDGTISVVSSTTPGDFDADGDVDGADFLLWQRNPSIGNLSDWQTNYGAPLVVTSTAAATGVPEPATALLLVLGLCGLASRRRG